MLAEFRLFTEGGGGWKFDPPVRLRKKSAPPVMPPKLPNSDNGGYDEKEKLAYLLSQGFNIEVVDPYADAFNKKYFVFENMPIGRRLIVVNEWGDIEDNQIGE